MAAPLTLAYLADPNSVHARRWIGYFAERGHRVHLLVADGAPVQPGLPGGVAVARFGSLGRRLPILGGLQARPALRRLLADLRPDVVHAHWLTSHGWLARLAAVRPLVVTPWGSDLLVAPRHSARARLRVRLTLAGADLVTVASRHLGDVAVRAGARRDRVALVRFGVDTARFAPGPPDPDLRRRLQLPEGRLLFSPRALRPLYRHDVVLDALAALPDDVSLLMTARHATADERARIDRRIRANRLGERVRILDDIADDDMVALIRDAAAVVSVPESDALPLTVLEAMACGTPVVATDHPGLRELVAPVAPDALVPVGDAVAVARAVAAILDLEHEQRDEIGCSLREVVVAEADHRTSMAAMEAHYRSLVAAG